MVCALLLCVLDRIGVQRLPARPLTSFPNSTPVAPFSGAAIGTPLAGARLPGSADARALRVIGITGYTPLMAKVMVSLPDDLLKAVDIEAERRGTTRSGLLRELAEESLRRRTTYRVERMAQIDVLDGLITGHQGGVAELVKTNRPEP
jgi:hypothetical protein